LSNKKLREYGGDFTTVKVAVVGVGNMGKNHARVYSEIKNVELVAVTDIDAKAAKEIAERFNVKWYSSHLELLENEEIDAVSVATPTLTHYDVCADILGSEKHVLVEKPIAVTQEQANKMISIANTNNVILMVGHIERFNPAVLKLKEVIDANTLGDLVSLSAKRAGSYSPTGRAIFDVVLDFAIHDIDVMRYLIGHKVTSVYSKTLSKFFDLADYVSAILEFENGVYGVIESNLFTPTKIRAMNITGTKGYAEMDFINQDIELYGNLTRMEFSTYEDPILKYSSTVISRPFVPKNEPLKIELEHFLDCIAKKKTPITSGEEGKRNLQVAQMILISAKENTPVNISE
jgi:UDP-N-acetylglucosamine 3-dehydrogenase